MIITCNILGNFAQNRNKTYKYMKDVKVYHVEIEDKHYYFASKQAIFDMFDKNSLGIKYSSFRNIKNLNTKPFDNGKCIIREGLLIRSNPNRRKSYEEE